MNTKTSELDAEDLLDPEGVLEVLNLVSQEKKFNWPRGKEAPQFSTEEIGNLAAFLFRKSPYVQLRVYKRLPRQKEMSIKKRAFIQHFFGAAKCNGAKAARLAGYSTRSAKQIAYRIKHT